MTGVSDPLFNSLSLSIVCSQILRKFHALLVIQTKFLRDFKIITIIIIIIIIVIVIVIIIIIIAFFYYYRTHSLSE